MLDGVGGGEWLVASLAGAVAVVAALLVYRDARRHGNYHALSATGAVAIAGLVGYAVGDVVGVFVGTGYVLLLYLLSYPRPQSLDAEGPRGDAGENIASEEAADTRSVIRVEVANHETLQELARRYDDVPDDGTEAELRSALREKALSEANDEDHGGPTATDRRPERGLSDPDAPAARASEYGIEEWSSDPAQPAGTAGEYSVGDWNADEPPAESDGDYGASEWSAEPAESGVPTTPGDEASAETCTAVEATAPDDGVWDRAGEETEQPVEGGMVFDNAVARETPETEPTPETAATDAESETGSPDTTGESSDDGTEHSEGDDDPFDGRGELSDADDTYDEEESRY